MHDLDAMLDAIRERVGVSRETAEQILARDTDTCRELVRNKQYLVGACGNCGKRHDDDAPDSEACEHLRAKRAAQVYLNLAINDAPMGVLPCTHCRAEGVVWIGPHSRKGCVSCGGGGDREGRGWWYPKGDHRAEPGEERPDALPPPAPPRPQPKAVPVSDNNARPDDLPTPPLARSRQRVSNKYGPKPSRTKAMRNRHKGWCTVCGAEVPEGAGFLTRNTGEGKKWLVYCHQHHNG